MKRQNRRRRVSMGTVVMLTLSCLVLVGFFSLLPRLTGIQDVRVNAAEIAVAFDESISQIASVRQNIMQNSSEPISVPFASRDADAPTPSPVITPTLAPKLSFTLCASGSLKFNGAVQKALSDENGYQFDILLEELEAALDSDLTIATFEDGVIPSAKLTDFNQPLDVLTALKGAGIDALSLGHYAVLDGGMSGLVETKQSLESAGILPYGAYTSADERNTPLVTQVNGLSVALLSYQSDLSSTGKKRTTPEEQSYAVANLQLPVVQADIAKAKEMGAQLVIVSLCWGRTNASAPTDTQLEMAQGIADAGADIILGTHSEAVQSVRILTANRGDDQYHPVLCAYSLGNLFTHNREQRTSLAGILIRVKVEYDTATGLVAFDDLAYTPTYCWRGKENGVHKYRVLPSSATQKPDYVDKDQAAVMERCLDIINTVMADSGFALNQ